MCVNLEWVAGSRQTVVDLENVRDTINPLKNEISSLKIKKSKLDTDIKKLKKVISRKDSKITKLGKQDIKGIYHHNFF